MGSIVTFYSYKGGVGRTMAVANIAILLAQRGLRVLAVDWDLEAPGLDRYFRNLEIQSSVEDRGLLDLLVDASTVTSSGQKPNWRDYLSTVKLDGQHTLDLFSCGRQDDEYVSRVLTFDWKVFFKDADGGSFIESLREDWKATYDFILIDSRTGITDSGGICTIQLPDILAPVFTTNERSLKGAKDIALRAQGARQKLAYDRTPLLIFPLPSHYDGRTQYEEARQWLKIFASELESFYKDWLPRNFTPIQIIERTKLPYIAYFSFGERLPVMTDGTSDPESLGYAYNVAATLIHNEFKNAGQIIAGGSLPSESASTSGQKFTRIVHTARQWWRRSALSRVAVGTMIFLALASSLLFLPPVRLVQYLRGTPTPTPTHTPTPSPAPELDNLSGEVEQVEVSEARDGNAQVLILLAIRNYGPPTTVRNYSLRVTNIRSSDIDLKEILPEELTKSISLKTGANKNVVIKQQDLITSKTREELGTNQVVSGWISFNIAAPAAFLREPGKGYIVSFADNNKTYKAQYVMF